ncbi:MAG: 50S ribosomal protein L22 [Acidimicrobiales bacterium]
MTGPKTNEREGTRAVLRGATMSAYKVREVLDLIRGEEVGRAAEILRFCERGAAEAVGKVLNSAVANAAHNDELDPEELFVSACFADEGKTQRRMRPRARGRATRIRKRRAHITVIVSRLPDDRLGRLRAKRAAEQTNRRARRVGGARDAAAERERRTGRAGRAGRAAPTTAPEHEPIPEGIADAELEAGIVDPQAAAVELTERGSVEAGAGAITESEAEEFHGAAEEAEEAGIVDTEAAAIEAAEQHQIHEAERAGEGTTAHDPATGATGAEGSEK